MNIYSLYHQDKFARWLLERLSYFISFNIEERTSNCSEKIYVKLINNQIIVDTEKVNYSFGSLHQVFCKAFKKIKSLNVACYKKVLILGFGAGSIYSILRNNYQFKRQIVAVEKDEVMIQLFHEYFKIEDPNLQLSQEDAIKFLETNNEKFDLLVIDLFIDDEVPKVFLSHQFIIQIQNKINKNGLLIWNYMVNNQIQKEEFERLLSIMDCKDSWFVVDEFNRIIYKEK